MFSTSRSRRGRRREWVLWGVPLAMVAVAGVLIASTQRQADYANWYQHWVTAAVGTLIALALERLPLSRLRPLLIPIYFITVASLVAVRLIGTTALGAQRWISIAGCMCSPRSSPRSPPFFWWQPCWPSSRGTTGGSVATTWCDLRPMAAGLHPARPGHLPGLRRSDADHAVLVGMPFEWLVLLLSPLITALLSGLLPWAMAAWIPLMAVLAYTSLPWKRLAALITVTIHGAMAAVTPWLWIHGLKDYQRDRLVLFLDPAQDPLGGGYHLLQSTVGIGSGGLLGTGLLQGQLTKLRFIPEQHTDFIFSALGEETGFLGCLFVVIGFALLMGRLLQVARNARSDFEALVVIGIGTMVMFQVVVNIFMTIGLGPVTGIPLPFLSYGRSAMIVNFIALGLSLSVVRQSRSTSAGHW